MKKSIRIYIESSDFQEIKELEKYGFEVEGNLIPFKSGFIQTMTISKNNLIVSLRNLCFSKKNILLKMIEKHKININMNKTKLFIKINNKETIVLNLWCTFNAVEANFNDKHLYLNEITDSQRFYYDSKNYLFISNIIDIEIIK